MFARLIPTALIFLSLGAHAATPPAVTLHGKTFSTEFATDDASREHGLMDRTELKPDHSMLFFFTDDEPRAFWMKNTLIPLDIIYIGANKKVVSIAEGKVKDDKTLLAKAPYLYVLELKQGTAKKYGIKPGTLFQLPSTLKPNY